MEFWKRCYSPDQKYACRVCGKETNLCADKGDGTWFNFYLCEEHLTDDVVWDLSVKDEEKRTHRLENLSTQELDECMVAHANNRQMNLRHGLQEVSPNFYRAPYNEINWGKVHGD